LELRVLQEKLTTVRALPGRLSGLSFSTGSRLSTVILYGCDGRLPTLFGGFWTGQMEVAHAEKVWSMAAEHAEMAKSFKAHMEQQQARQRGLLHRQPIVGFDHIVVSEIEVPNLLVNFYEVDEWWCEATMRPNASACSRWQ
jgi:hypothetical protein